MKRCLQICMLCVLVILTGCGRQVTPSTGEYDGLPAGTMSILFTTVGPMDFTRYRYAIVFNTTGNGQEPYANTFLTSFLNDSFAWIVGGQGGIVSPTLEQFYPISNGIGSVIVSVPPGAVQLTTNANGQSSSFLLTFQRSIFTTSAPGGTGLPTPIPPQALWTINVFTIDANNAILDAGGQGVNDTSFLLSLNTTQAIQITNPFQKAGAPTLPDPASQIAGGTITNAP